MKKRRQLLAAVLSALLLVSAPPNSIPAAINDPVESTETTDIPADTEEELTELSSPTESQSEISDDPTTSSEDEKDYILGRPLTEEEIQEQIALEPQLSDLHEEPEEIDAPDPSSMSLYAQLPERYDLRTEGAVTSVKDQGSEGLCWAYSTVSAMESSMRKYEGSLPQSAEAPSNPDYSESHLGYVTFTQAADPLGLISEDSSSYKDGVISGGDISMAAMTLTQWKGPAAEGTPLEAENAFSHSGILKDYILMQGSTESNRDQIKAAIMTYGALSVSMYYHSFYLNRDTAAYCTPNKKGTNHAISIVGWDDTYSLNNFLTSVQAAAAADGAWICKNSYGSDWGDGGYFYMSYNDPNINKIIACSMLPADTYDYNYQYDGAMGGQYYPLKPGYEAANIYHVRGNSSGDELLKAVGYQLQTAEATVKFSVYKDLKDLSDPKSGTLAYESGEITSLYPGYYTEELDAPVALKYGSAFSIVFEMVSDAGFCFETTYEGTYYTYTAHTEPQQSMYSINGWVDIHKNNQCFRIKALTSATEKIIQEPTEEPEPTPTESLEPTETPEPTETAKPTPTAKPQKTKASKIRLNKGSITLNKGKTYSLQAAISPSNASDKTVKWTSSNTKVAVVSQKGIVTAKGGGQAVITAKTADGTNLAASCKVTVRYSIAYVINGGKKPAKNPTAYYNQYVRLYPATRKGYRFLGWYTNKNLKAGKITSIAKGKKRNYTLYAKWEKVKTEQVKNVKLKNCVKGRLTISYNAVKGAKYRIWVYDRKTRKAKYYYTSKTTYTVKNLKKGRCYTVRVRAYKTDSLNYKVYGKRSAPVSRNLRR